jgi:hydroxyacyl-ACP dehydratase HTD2-like protein with hotdog domain
MTDGPVVEDSARDLVGAVTFTWTSEPVSLRQVREYVAAIGERPEDWTSDTVVTPPLFFHAACRPVVAEADLLADGQYPFLGVPGVHGRTMAGGQTYEILAPVRIGDVLTVTERLVSLTEKQGRSGSLVFTETASEYTNGDGVLVARFRQTVIFR